MQLDKKTLLVLAAFLATVQAVPTVDLNFDWADNAVILYTTILLVGLWILAPFTGFSMGTMSGEGLANVREEMKNKWGGFYYAIPLWIPGIIKFVMQVVGWILFAGYLLDRFENAAGDPQAITETWKTVVVILVAAAFRFDLEAAAWYNRLMWFGPAAFVAFLELLAWGGAVGFLIAEIIQLPDTIDTIWQVALAIYAGAFFLLSLFYFGMYVLSAIIGVDKAYTTAGGNKDY